MAESCAILLGLLGHDVRVAATCAEAVRVAVGFAPDLVLLDIGLPDDDGYELTDQLVPALSRRPLIVALTGYPHFEERSERAGLDGHLVKPVAQDALAAVLSVACNNRVQHWPNEPPMM